MPFVLFFLVGAYVGAKFALANPKEAAIAVELVEGRADLEQIRQLINATVQREVARLLAA